MDVFYAYTYGTAGWLFLQAGPLIASPTIIVTLLSPDVREPTAMEEYLCRSLGIGLIALGLMTILLTGSIPLTSSLSDTVGNGTSTEAYDPKAPYAVPSLTITTLYNSAIAFYCYARFNTVGSMAFAAAASGYGGLAAVGLWCILFASSSGRISRKTLVDKRQSSYPFANTAADKKRKGKAS